MNIVPITQKAANAFVKMHHRHHKPVVGSVFQVACAIGYAACDVATKEEIEVLQVVGVAIVGRPVSRRIWESVRSPKLKGLTLEVNRLCTTGEQNVCSKLYSAAKRVARELGYKMLITYILNTESGVSLRACGWVFVGERGGGDWNCPSRPRNETELKQKKLMYQVLL